MPEMPSSLYRPLDELSCEFRLLRLLDENKDIIEAKLESFPFAKPHELPRYTALSYCWTDATPSRTIRLSGHEIPVRPNLLAFLQAAKGRDLGWMFIDALCIDQSNTAERSSQVRLMGDIYRNASQVVGWLGAGDEAGRVKVADLANHLDSPQDSNMSAVEMGDLTDAVVTTLSANQYWTRLWVVQEVMLAQRLFLWYGDYKLEPDQLLRGLRSTAASVYEDRDTPRPDQLLAAYEGLQLTTYFTKSAMMFTLMGQRERLAKNPYSLVRAVSVFGNQACRDIHDKIFGFLGIIGSVIKPDYDMPLSELYLRALIEGWEQAKRVKENKSGLLGMADDGIEFILNLTQAFGYSTWDTMVALLVQQITGQLEDLELALYWQRGNSLDDAWSAEGFQGLARNFNTRMSLLPGVWSIQYSMLESRLKRAKADNCQLGMPGVGEKSRSCSEWGELVQLLTHEIKEAMSL